MLVLRDETRDCLELLVEMRLALSSLITVEAREDVVVPLSVVPLSVVPLSEEEEEVVPLSVVPLSVVPLSVVPLSVVPVSVVPVSAVVEEPPPPSSLLQEIMVRLKRKIKIICRILFIITLPH